MWKKKVWQGGAGWAHTGFAVSDAPDQVDSDSEQELGRKKEGSEE